MVYRFITVNVIVYGKSIIVYHCHKPMGFCICLAYFSLSMSLSLFIVFSWLLVYHCHGLWWSFGHCASTSYADPPIRIRDRQELRQSLLTSDLSASRQGGAVDHGWWRLMLQEPWERTKKSGWCFTKAICWWDCKPLVDYVDGQISEELQEMGLVTWKCWEPPKKPIDSSSCFSIRTAITTFLRHPNHDYNVRPPSDVSWFISPSNYSYKYHKP
jgi:hypothetical protein